MKNKKVGILMLKNKWNVLIIIVSFFFPTTAFADVPIPTISIFFPVMILLLIPIIIIEAWVGVQRLSFKWGEAFKVSIVANLVSTLLGIPLTHLILGDSLYMLYGFVGTQTEAKGILFYITTGMLQPFLLFPGWKPWVYFLVLIGLLIPTFFITVWIERIIATRLLKSKNTPREIAKEWSFHANLVSYLFIAVVLIIYMGILFIKDAKL